jgi:DNA-directed RNA polymerase omega subunit
MARVTVEDCLDNEDNRFALVILASNRTRQIMKGAKVQLEAHKYKNKPAVLALREIAAGGSARRRGLARPRSAHTRVERQQQSTKRDRRQGRWTWRVLRSWPDG